MVQVPRQSLLPALVFLLFFLHIRAGIPQSILLELQHSIVIAYYLASFSPFESPLASWLNPSEDAIYVADGMANAHNMLIRCLNSIYLQAPYVKEEADIQDLLQYSLFWEKWIHGHHDAEERFFFPEVEKITKEKGTMDKNVEQHQAFHPGMEAWAQYTTECMKKESSQKFDAAHFKKLIDGFAPQLVKHLGEEIPTLLALDKYDIAAVKRAFQHWDKQVQADADVWSIYPLGMGNVDWTYEGGNNFPELPFFVPYLVHYVFGRKYRSVWRFNPNTLFGEKRPLVFLPKDDGEES